MNLGTQDIVATGAVRRLNAEKSRVSISHERAF
jgi:hypothetical protein